MLWTRFTTSSFKWIKLEFLNIYKIKKIPTLTCGYDSLGGRCETNHLHFEFLMENDFNNEISNFPIENFLKINYYYKLN